MTDRPYIPGKPALFPITRDESLALAQLAWDMKGVLNRFLAADPDAARTLLRRHPHLKNVALQLSRNFLHHIERARPDLNSPVGTMPAFRKERSNAA